MEDLRVDIWVNKDAVTRGMFEYLVGWNDEICGSFYDGSDAIEFIRKAFSDYDTSDVVVWVNDWDDYYFEDLDLIDWDEVEDKILWGCM